ncbi:MAG: cell wall-active antibiotics response protein [Ignavibacteriales bacterium]|nr:cell wall-active antibiotics response protein [Ignavibacteriales bacterium]
MNSKTAGFILVFIGILFFLDTLDIADFGELIHRFWPLILILIGIRMLVNYNRKKDITPEHQSSQSGQTYSAGETIPPPVPPTFSSTTQSISNSDTINESEIFGELSLDVTSQNFRGGRISAVFGDVKIDLTKSMVADGDYVLDLSSVFGDITLLISKDTAVSIQSEATFGGIRIFDQRRDGMFPKLNYKSANFDSSSKRLHIVTSSVFGDCKVW